MDETRYTMDELVAASGLPRRTIRFYIQQGLLEPPAGRGRGGFYSDEHLARLVAIVGLQQEGLKLAAIRTRLDARPVVPDAAAEVAAAVPCPGEAAPGETRLHFRLGAGIELVVPSDFAKRRRMEIEALLAAAHTILKEHDDDHRT